MKYRKKPTTYQAFKITEQGFEEKTDWPEWLHKAWDKKSKTTDSFFGTDERGLVDAGIDKLFIQVGYGSGSRRHSVQWGHVIFISNSGSINSMYESMFNERYEAVE